jgi:2-polyprenyl-3-methyl-5-hydroxy-6-metoxy-1,4-benzoquinol methylase
MSEGKAREIIERAMADRKTYEEMASREGDFWGRVLPSWEHSEARAQDAVAAAELRLARHRGSLRRLAKEKELKFEKGLTLGCGAGRLERSLLHDGVCRSFHGVDISEQAIAEAQETAKREDLPLSYEVGDLNFLELPKKTYDLVVAQTSLHHVLFLEHVAEQIHGCLKDDGYLWVHDFIGETQGQYDPKRLSLINRLLAILPEKFRANRMSGRIKTKVTSPEPGRLSSPFEKIRSGEIVAVFERWFTIEWKREFGAFLHWVVPPGTRMAFTENADTKALFELLMLLDQLCVEEGIVRPAGGQYLMRPRARIPAGEQEKTSTA